MDAILQLVISAFLFIYFSEIFELMVTVEKRNILAFGMKSQTMC